MRLSDISKPSTYLLSIYCAAEFVNGGKKLPATSYRLPTGFRDAGDGDVRPACVPSNVLFPHED